MLPEQIDQLRQQYTDQSVEVVGDEPELARFRGLVGVVKTVNMGGFALVQFADVPDRAWYDLAVDCLKIVDKPPSKVAEKKSSAVCKGKAAEKPSAGA